MTVCGVDGSLDKKKNEINSNNCLFLPYLSNETKCILYRNICQAHRCMPCTKSKMSHRKSSRAGSSDPFDQFWVKPLELLYNVKKSDGWLTRKHLSRSVSHDWQGPGAPVKHTALSHPSWALVSCPKGYFIMACQWDRAVLFFSALALDRRRPPSLSSPSQIHEPSEQTWLIQQV